MIGKLLGLLTPIYKSEDKTDCANYRSISIISDVAKVFEKIIYNQLFAFLNENKVLTENQSGFRLNHSTETTLLHITNSWLANMDKGLINGVVFLDLKRHLTRLIIPYSYPSLNVVG